MPTVYIAGPMRGKPRFNFNAFERAARRLRGLMLSVISPAEIDLAEGFDPDNPGAIEESRYESWMRRDFKLLAQCDYIYLLDGWETSDGARRELSAAIAMGLVVKLESQPWEARAC